MTHCGREYLAKRTVQHYKIIAKRKKSITVHHFMAPLQTIYAIIQKYDTSSIVEDRSRSGRSKRISTGHRTRLKTLMNYQTGIPLRKVAQKFNVHRRTIQHELKDMSVYYGKKETCSLLYRKKLEKLQNVLDVHIVRYWKMIMS